MSARENQRVSKYGGFRHESLNRLGRIVRRELRTSIRVGILKRQERTKRDLRLGLQVG